MWPGSVYRRGKGGWMKGGVLAIKVDPAMALCSLENLIRIRLLYNICFNGTHFFKYKINA